MTTRINALLLSSISLAAVGLLPACSPGTDNEGRPRDVSSPPRSSQPSQQPATPTTPSPTIPPNDASPPNAAPPGGPAGAPIGVLPRTTDKQVIARAELLPTQGNTAMGTITFTRDGDTTTVQVALTGLTPGPHGIHIHENGDCSAPDASSAGEHFNPEGRPHGGLDTLPTERHPGDLGNVTAKDTGEVDEMITSNTLAPNGEFAMAGKAIVVHERMDDESSQPSGDSGDPAACGVIMALPLAPGAHLG